MRTYLADIIPKIQRFSKRLDYLTKLTNQHWVSLGDIENGKTVFMFRDNNKLLIGENGITVHRGTWEYMGNQSLLVETSNGGYLLKHGFFDENVIALKLDSTNKYAFFVNEAKYDNELNNIGDLLKFLDDKYLINSHSNSTFVGGKPKESSLPTGTSATYKTKQGMLTLTGEYITLNKKVIRATLDRKKAPDGRYRLGFMWYVNVESGLVV
ncbi:MAG: hypothetical protein LW852_11605 [Sediminibacterium sp.]|jgi:hypothetical protein|nr:hypothetical protein [Sediminibacterium sp.]